MSMHKLTNWPWLLIAICLLISAMSVAYGQQPSAIDKGHTRWILQVMRKIQTIKPGMTRGDLRKIFVEEGGLSARTQRKYVYKTCPYIKVDIEFSPSDNDRSTEKPEDTIVSVSRPYLEYSVMD